MSPSEHSFFAYGEPKGQPRARAVIRGRRAGVFDPGTADAWKNCVKLAATEAGLRGALLGGPLSLSLGFVFPRPAGHHRSNDRAKPLKPQAPHAMTSKPDADNAAKAVMDALTDLSVWGDDAQVCLLRVGKAYGEAPGCRIEIGAAANEQLSGRAQGKESPMSKQNEPGSAFAPASGYATAVDAAMHLATEGFTCARLQDSGKALALLAEMKTGEIYSEVAAKVLAAEVRRLLGDMIVMRAMVKAGHDLETIDRVLSHNNEAEGRRQ